MGYRNIAIEPYVKLGTLIETGTYCGGTAEIALRLGYKQVRSVELHDGLFAKCQEKFKNDPRVLLWHGKSRDCLWDMIKDLNQQLVFWLDAHPAGNGTAENEELKVNPGEENEFSMNSILLSELALIAQHTIKNHVILIDDQNNIFNTKLMNFITNKINKDYKYSLINFFTWEEASEVFIGKVLQAIVPEKK